MAWAAKEVYTIPELLEHPLLYLDEHGSYVYTLADIANMLDALSQSTTEEHDAIRAFCAREKSPYKEHSASDDDSYDLTLMVCEPEENHGTADAFSQAMTKRLARLKLEYGRDMKRLTHDSSANRGPRMDPPLKIVDAKRTSKGRMRRHSSMLDSRELIRIRKIEVAAERVVAAKGSAARQGLATDERYFNRRTVDSSASWRISSSPESEQEYVSAQIVDGGGRTIMADSCIPTRPTKKKRDNSNGVKGRSKLFEGDVRMYYDCHKGVEKPTVFGDDQRHKTVPRAKEQHALGAELQAQYRPRKARAACDHDILDLILYGAMVVMACVASFIVWFLLKVFFSTWD